MLCTLISCSLCYALLEMTVTSIAAIVYTVSILCVQDSVNFIKQNSSLCYSMFVPAHVHCPLIHYITAHAVLFVGRW